MSVATETTVRSGEIIRVTRSRRNVAWTGIGALVVVVVLALFPYIVYAGTTTVDQGTLTLNNGGSLLNAMTAINVNVGAAQAEDEIDRESTTRPSTANTAKVVVDILRKLAMVTMSLPVPVDRASTCR